MKGEHLGAAHQENLAGIAWIGAGTPSIDPGRVGALSDAARFGFGCEQLGASGAVLDEEHLPVVGGEIREMEIEVVGGVGSGGELVDANTRDGIGNRLSTARIAAGILIGLGAWFHEGEHQEAPSGHGSSESKR